MRIVESKGTNPIDKKDLDRYNAGDEDSSYRNIPTNHVLEIEIEGLTPLMHSNPEVMEIDPRKLMALSPSERCAHQLYKTEKSFYIPNSHIHASLIQGATMFKKKGLKTHKDTAIETVRVIPEKIKLEANKWEVDSRRAVIGGKSAIIVHRPIYKNWKASFFLQVSDPTVSPTDVREWIEMSGLRKGIGTGRDLGFGRFKITKYSEYKA